MGPRRDLRDILCGRLAELAESQLAFFVAYVHAIEGQRVKVHVKPERTVGSLHEGECPNLPIADRAQGQLTLRAERSITVNVRVIAATHRDLESMVRAGTFREDLFFRLNVFPIQIAPLRERPEDVPELARRKLKRLAERSALPLPTLPKEALTRLARHDWPGNVRELESVVERCFIRSRGGRLRVPDLSSPPPSLAAPPAQVGTLADCIREHIENALMTSRGKIYGDDGAAQALGLKPSTLQTKMRKYGIRRDSFLPSRG